MLSVYPQLPELLTRAVVEDLHCTLQLEPAGPVSANEVPGAISRALSGWQALPAGMPGLSVPTWVGKNRTARLQWPHLSSTFKAETKKVEQGVRHGTEVLVKHATRIHNRLVGIAKIRFAAFVVDIHFSTMAPSALPNAGVVGASFVRMPESVGPLVDAEWRAATINGDRYFKNWGISTYETRKFVAQATLGPGGPSPAEITSSELLDAGLRLRIDVNTKVNLLRGTGQIEVGIDDFEQIRDLAIDAAALGYKMLRDYAQ